MGFTNAPARRLRQHNGAVVGGARATRGWRPWDMAMFVHGFPAHSPALAFEWHWQNPTRSTLLREAAAKAGARGRRGGRGRVRMMHALLHQPPFCELPLVVQVLDSKYSELLADLDPFPPQVPVVVAPVDDLAEGPALGSEVATSFASQGSFDAGSWGSAAAGWAPEDFALVGDDGADSPSGAGPFTLGDAREVGAPSWTPEREVVAGPEAQVYDLVSPESENSLAESPLPLGDMKRNLSAGGGQGGRPKRASSGGNSGGARRSVPREVIDLED